MKKPGETAGEDGKAPEKQKENPAAERWVRWSSRDPAASCEGGASRTDPRPKGREIQAAVGGVRQPAGLSTPSTGAAVSTALEQSSLREAEVTLVRENQVINEFHLE
jgi:hypothetical protein